MVYNRRRKELLIELCQLLKKIEKMVDVIIVEGLRDVKALKRLGYSGEIEYCYIVGLSDYDVFSNLAKKYQRILLLTDFDQEGFSLNEKFTTLLEHEGVKVERNLRREIGRLTAALGIYEIEDLDNLMKKLKS